MSNRLFRVNVCIYYNGCKVSENILWPSLYCALNHI